jgi:hypothetical protein
MRLAMVVPFLTIGSESECMSLSLPYQRPSYLPLLRTSEREAYAILLLAR